MGLFDFGNKQRMHTQMVGETSGREMFVMEQYNLKKKNCGACIGFGIFNLMIVVALFYFINKERSK